MTKELKKQKFELILNEMKHDISDPTKTHASFIIMDTTTSLNNVKVSEQVLLDAKASILGMPIVTKFNADELDFGTHEEFLDEDLEGNQFVNRDTIAIGSFTSEGYMKDVEVDGEMRKVFMADGVLWRSRYKDAIELLESFINEGKSIPMSSEYLYANYSFVDGVEEHHSPIFFEGHCLLGQKVTPAYESAKILSINNSEVSQFNRLVASAINQNKEVSELPKKEEKEVKNQLNALSMRDISRHIEEQVKATMEDSWIWISDLYADYAIIAVESEDMYKHYRVDYSATETEVIVDLESMTEVEEKREWVAVTNSLNEEISQLNNKIEELTSDKADIVSKLETATETIVQLNADLEEFNTIKEQMLNAEREAKLDEAKAKYAKVLNSKIYEAEEVQTLILNSIEDGEVGLNAKVALADLILEQSNSAIEEEKEEPKQQFNASEWVASMTAKQRKFDEVSDKDDVLAEYRL